MFHPRRTHRRALRALLLPLAAGLALTALPATSAQAASTLTNGGFEADGSGAAVPNGWSEYGDTGASYVESGGHGGSYRLSHYSASAYKVETYQYLSGLTNGNYKLTAWVRSGGGQKSAYIALKNCGSAEQRTDLPVSASGWIRIVVPIAVTNNQCTISVNSDANAGNWINVDDLTFASGTGGLSVKGADISSLPKSEALGGTYKTSSGTTTDALTVLKNSGMNYARVKVWVNPADGYNNKARVLALAKRIKAQGMKLLVDFHYSDTWADPGAQSKPSAWAGHSYSQLKADVYNHTYDVLGALKSQGTTADMVQVGNEINGGMLWSEGSTDNWSQLAGLLNSGYNAVKAVNSGTTVALHLAKGGDLAGTRWWFDSAVSNGVKFDAIGLSYYGYWHGSLSDFQTTLDDAASRYGKPVFVAETAYPFRLDSEDSHENIIDTTGELVSGYAASTAGQSAWFRDILNIVEAVPNGRGLGVFYWEATWTAVTGNGWDPTDSSSGNGWENQALFGYDDKALPAMTWFSHR
ncbi:glycosyl hydrolase 53 family protein [Streptomyces turgidiscabies]|uniref:Arabinogalactan endo-beta-1,4-galactanase n=1 Tax=Streptomyces turgidiscabies (strain Car8) TaxID=698760 RepID=L7EVV6_STRT8|nr:MULTISPECIES: glycosyl hydrolase 53 family protein [Streptomyces]ELP63548.1 glycosyl hydrolase, family 53 [Streptomyces turgidiscabies Car8]MDX3496199.1 glycosyl hydrolase 53 family protein [Streptomyces turgidiscabies]GAQ75306.1 arabinogalactan endo-1,4-beta-galactosidase [Streptomyces turgidiscabies]